MPLTIATAIVFSGVFRCPSLWLFGLPCPGCGLSRAAWAMLRLDFAEMWRMQPLAPVVVPFVGWMLLRAGLEQAGWLDRDARWFRGARWAPAVIFAGLLGVYAIRAAGGLGGLP